MNKLDVIAALQAEAKIPREDAAKVVQLFFDSMTSAMVKGERVEVRGLCSFYVKKYKGYVGRNPKTGEEVTIKPKKLPFFKCGKELKERINSKKNRGIKEKIMEASFSKMHGIGNDFVLFDDRSGRIAEKTDYGELAEKLCCRRFGIGADGLIFILESDPCDFRFRVFNSDGSEAEICGNGIRCFARYLYEKKITDKTVLEIETNAGVIITEIFLGDSGSVESVRVDMGEPEFTASRIPFVSDSERVVAEALDIGDGVVMHATMVSMGNPHAVVFTDNVRDIRLDETGPKIENNERFPEKTNVEFVQVLSEDELVMRVWERGAGETAACGSGACAALAAAHLNSLAGKKAIVYLDGGDLLIEWNRDDNHIYKTGPAELSFEGSVVI